jgi:hypothetical protein
VPESLWVAELTISPAVQTKLSDADHRLDADDVRQAIVAVQGLRFKWRTDPPRGRRVYVEISMGAKRVLAALYPVDHPMGDLYALGSAYHEPRGLDAVKSDPDPDALTQGESS